MKDAFNRDINLGNTVLYSTHDCGGTIYNIGKVVKLYPSISTKIGWNPDRVRIQLELSNQKSFSKNPILYAMNVIVLSPAFASDLKLSMSKLGD